MKIKTRTADFLTYLEDTSNLSGNADRLYLPETQEELRELLMSCYTGKIPVTISGGRSGTTGGAVPLGGVLISMEDLDRIISFSADKKTVLVEAGVTLEKLEEQSNRKGLSLRPQPTEYLAFAGGAVSTGASGLRGIKYGSIRNYVRKVKIILMDGTILEIPRGRIFARNRKFKFNLGGRDFEFDIPGYTMPSVKHQAGYFARDNMDLIDLFIGSEGTLGVIVEVEFLLQKLAGEIIDCIVFFPGESQALEFVKRVKNLKKEGVLDPASLDFFDNNSLSFLKPVYPLIETAQAAVLFEQEIEPDDEGSMEAWLDLVEEYGIKPDSTWLGDNPASREKIRKFRHALPQRINEFLRSHKQAKLSADIAVPDIAFERMYSFYKKVGEKTGVFYVNFGHIGENHLHFNFLPVDREEYDIARDYLIKCMEKAVSLGGTISAEHGIGKIKKDYLKILYPPESVMEMAAVKKYFDPYLLLGQGTLFDYEASS